MNYLSQVGELAILSLVIKPTVQNKSFHSNSTFEICRLLQATVYNQFPVHVTYAMYIQKKSQSDLKHIGSDYLIFILVL